MEIDLSAYEYTMWRFLFFLTCFSFMLLLGSAHLILSVCVFLFVVVPLIFRYSYTLQRSMLFLNFVRWPRNFNYSAPEKAGLSGTRNFHLTSDDGITLGVWQILPGVLINESRKVDASDEWYEAQLKDGKPVFLYMHGNSGSRAAEHRLQLYKVLRNMDYHVVAFDYRSYGDSSPVEPSEDGLVADGMFMYKWLQKRVGNSPLFVWGHSLGTGVSSHALAKLSTEGIESYGLVLEAPFNNMRDELRAHPFAQVFAFLPWFDNCFVWPMYNNGLKFDSDVHVSKIRAPVAILHAEDDRIVPFHLGQKLYHFMLENRSVQSLGEQFWRFESKFGYGHKYIYKDHSVPYIIKEFVETSIEKRKKSTQKTD
ncbi:lysophosphatidylserine lipase ABHD12 isoform X2 [Thrips palmi]|uniref:Lysophosphatidylserine lipase ABHD12 isoform X2 n=1 Tax=Thrips palmi TaxID=161013 RepID=A0A6P8Y433_THRPL|nr:lysophosphatidylserine lipase ABHD12 isoform X2 [Thrips palmi]XP_034231133.1 lysophosphatidylserine lipase ABHD12 isoform X2 [Thrips palmi]XP_034231134.1 lysophosphatidylserine lipase ABHD12 isoform X2 [Thrips palmi]XP_034231135.1 lysophosphatidylserine lipase ABHD12 isoform X2 [Thrips palmi]